MSTFDAFARQRLHGHNAAALLMSFVVFNGNVENLSVLNAGHGVGVAVAEMHAGSGVESGGSIGRNSNKNSFRHGKSPLFFEIRDNAALRTSCRRPERNEPQQAVDETRAARSGSAETPGETPAESAESSAFHKPGIPGSLCRKSSGNADAASIRT